MEPRQLVQQLADKAARAEAMRALVGGVTATELRRVGRVPDDVFDALLDGLRHPNPQVRWWTIQILDHVPDPRAYDAVAALLDDPVPRVRRNAAHALGCVACKPSTAGQALADDVLDRLAALAQRDPSIKVRREASLALRCRAGRSR